MLVRVLLSGDEELLHRALVLVGTMAETGQDACVHLLQGGVVPCLTQLVDENISPAMADMVNSVAMTLSKIKM